MRIGVARDRAFCFYYEDSLDLLRQLGAELVPFSPLADERLPDGVQGLYLGGGYPELYAAQLEANHTLRRQIRGAVHAGMPCIAECGGFMYLTQSIAGHAMVGALPGDCFDTGKLTRFGYITATAQEDSLLCRAGEQVPMHEFHHWDTPQPGGAFLAEKPSGKQWRCAYATDTLYAGFPHFHFYAKPVMAQRFLAVMFALPQILLIGSRVIDKTSFSVPSVVAKKNSRGRMTVNGMVYGHINGTVRGMIHATVEGDVDLTSAQADSSSGDSRRASMAGRASASTGNVSPSSQRSRATGRRAESRTAAIALRRLSAPAVTAVIHSVAAARTMAARRVKRLFFTGIPPLRYRQAYAAAERDMIFSLQNGAKSGIMQKRRHRGQKCSIM